MIHEIAALALPTALGLLAGAAHLFDKPRAAVHALNRYALTFAFPALIVRSLIDPTFAPPTNAAFFLIVPLGLLLALSVILLTSQLFPSLRPFRGSAALLASFGNVAYLGLPLIAVLLGPTVVGLAALLVACHIVAGLLVGPALLLAWSPGTHADRPGLGVLLRQPLLWAPVVGLLARWLPATTGAAVDSLITPVASSAAPVALFLLGLYLHGERRAVLRPSLGALVHVLTKLVVLPLCTVSALWLLSYVGPLPEGGATAALLLSTMPAAITTFSLSESLGVAEVAVAQAIVLTTLVAALVGPWLWPWLAAGWG